MVLLVRSAFENDTRTPFRSNLEFESFTSRHPRPQTESTSDSEPVDVRSWPKADIDNRAGANRTRLIHTPLWRGLLVSCRHLEIFFRDKVHTKGEMAYAKEDAIPVNNNGDSLDIN